MSQTISDLHAPSAVLTSHVLNMVSGRPARNVEITLFRVEPDALVTLKKMTTNADGRLEAPLLTADDASAGMYRLEFGVSSCVGTGGYFDIVPVEFRIVDPAGHYHVPLVISPYGYSSYRGAPPDRAPNDGGQWAVKAPDGSTEDKPAAPPPGTGGAGLTTHVIDIARGCGGGPMKVDISKLDRETGKVELIRQTSTTAEGRTGQWLIEAGELEAGIYELGFHLGDYFLEAGFGIGAQPFFERVPVRFSVTNPGTHQHIPLLVAPWGYSVYRGS